MCERNVEVVRRFFSAVERVLEVLGPERSLRERLASGDVPPAALEALACVTPGIEWKPAFSGETYRGPTEIAKGWDELLDAAEAYSLRLLEVEDLGNNRLLAVFGPSLEGKT